MGLSDFAQATLDAPADADLPLAFHGTIIHSLTPQQVEIIEEGLIIVGSNGIITHFHKNLPLDKLDSFLVEHDFTPGSLNIQMLKRGEFLVPGFVDTHNHAPQWAQRGIGRGQLLIDWLNKTTFPHESKFKDHDYAWRTYTSCVKGFVRQGITTACYYGSFHGPATKILADICQKLGQRAFVGKCNMNRNAPDYCRDMTVEESLESTRDFIDHVRRIDPNFELVTPILTPRFAISCDGEVLAGLGQIAAEQPDLPIQTHFDEAEQEMEVTKQLFPEFKSEADLYDHFGLMTDRTILAHCIFCGEYEMQRIKERNCGVAHCPISTSTGGFFGVAPIREYLRREIKVGLGTDSGGGYSSSILDAMRLAFVISNARATATKGKDPELSLQEGFYLATLGGAQVCGLEKKIGNFGEGKIFDALLIDTVSDKYRGIIAPIEDEDSTETIFEKFLMTADDRNIVDVYVKGRQIK